MATITLPRQGYNWRVFGAWLALSFVGMAASLWVAVPLMWRVAGVVERSSSERLAVLAAGAVLGLGLGAGSGLLPGLVLRGKASGLARWWAGSLLAGAAGGAAVMALAAGRGFDQAAWALLGGVGVAIGLGQWLALRGQAARAAWLILGSSVAVGAGFGVALPLGGEGREALAIGAFALVHALISASAMGWILAEGE